MTGYLIKNYEKPVERTLLTPSQPKDLFDFSCIAVTGMRQLKEIGTSNATTVSHCPSLAFICTLPVHRSIENIRRDSELSALESSVSADLVCRLARCTQLLEHQC